MPEEKRDNEIHQNLNENEPRKPWQTPIVEELMVDQTLGTGGSMRESIGNKV
jgi:hypothetical protein